MSAGRYEDLSRRLLAPGSLFELVTQRDGESDIRRFVRGPQRLPDLYRRARAFGPKRFLVCPGRAWDFAETFEQADRLARALASSSYRAGDRVALELPGPHDWVAAFIGLTGHGFCAVLSDPHWSESRRADAAAICGCALRLTRMEDSGRSAGARPTREVLDDEAIIAFTSGSTGAPKGVSIDHSGLVTSLRSAMLMAALTAEPRGAADQDSAGVGASMTFSPLHYVGGYTAVLFALISSAPLVLAHAFGEDAFDQIARFEVRSLGGVTRSHLSELIARCEQNRQRFQSIRQINYFGATLDASPVGDVRRLLPRAGLASGYGMTETNGLVTAGVLSDFVARAGTCGRLSPLVDLRILDRDGNTVAAPGESGAIEVRGAVLASAYVSDGETTPLRPGWFATGDQGALDPDGYLYIDGRERTVSLAGRTIDLAQMERGVRTLDGVGEVAFAVHEQRQILVVGVSPANVAVGPIQERLVHLSGLAAERLCVVAVDRLPMTASGKVARTQAAEMILRLAPS